MGPGWLRSDREEGGGGGGLVDSHGHGDQAAGLVSGCLWALGGCSPPRGWGFGGQCRRARAWGSTSRARWGPCAGSWWLRSDKGGGGLGPLWAQAGLAITKLGSFWGMCGPLVAAARQGSWDLGRQGGGGGGQFGRARAWGSTSPARFGPCAGSWWLRSDKGGWGLGAVLGSGGPGNHEAGLVLGHVWDLGPCCPPRQVGFGGAISDMRGTGAQQAGLVWGRAHTRGVLRCAALRCAVLLSARECVCA